MIDLRKEQILVLKVAKDATEPAEILIADVPA